VRQLRPGDTLFFGAGTFRGHLFADLEGTPLTPITLRGTKAVDGAGLLTTFEARNRERDTLEVRGSSYLVIRDFNITGASRAGIRLNNSHYITH
jgi:hypothetical protein